MGLGLGLGLELGLGLGLGSRATATHQEMLLHVVLLVGAVRAVWAHKWLLSSMNTQVSFEVIFLIFSMEGFVAEGTSGHSISSR